MSVVSISDISTILDSVRNFILYHVGLLNKKAGIDLSRSEYDNLVSSGTIDPDANYFIHEDEE